MYHFKLDPWFQKLNIFLEILWCIFSKNVLLTYQKVFYRIRNTLPGYFCLFCVFSSLYSDKFIDQYLDILLFEQQIPRGRPNCSKKYGFLPHLRTMLRHRIHGPKSQRSHNAYGPLIMENDVLERKRACNQSDF